VVPSGAGLHIAIRLADGLSAHAVTAAAAARDVAVEPLDPCYAGGVPGPGLLLGFGAIDVNDVRDGIARLGEVLAARQPGA
jgi:GntR family transcriptional regulator/MocR family aminotransferase